MQKPFTTGTTLLIASFMVSLLHHTDHVLRIDHSGWPFIPPVSPFTYSLLVYPVFFSIFLNLRKPLYCTLATGFLFLVATAAHIFFEPLRDGYHTWTYGSSLPQHKGEENLLGVRSPVLGVASVSLAILLSLVLLCTVVAFAKEYRASKRGSRPD